MKNSKVVKTNIIISVILVIGFLLTALFSYQANYKDSLDNIEQVSSLTAEGIYYQLTSMLTKPVNISLTMSNDNLLKDHLLSEPEDTEDKTYIQTTRDYLNAYQKKYGFDSVFLVSSATGRYYNFNGLDRVLTRDNPENVWYYTLLESSEEYGVVVDNDEVTGADNAITVFVNCKILGDDGSVLGMVGVGLRIDYLKDLLKDYEDKFNVKAYLVDEAGDIEISTSHTGYNKINWFEHLGTENIQKEVLDWKEDQSSKEIWTQSTGSNSEEKYVVTRYLPELSWHLIVEQNTGRIISEMHQRIIQTCLMILVVIVTILFVITTVIRNFNKQITHLMEEKQKIFQKATEQLYDNIYELNITQNCAAGKRTQEYFADLGAADLPYDQALSVIADKTVKEEFREGYVNLFSPKNVLREYDAGNDHLRYDFMITQDGSHYFWMRIDAHIFYMPEDHSIHMFTYRKNIDEEKRRELQIEKKAQVDEMTGFLSKKTTERLIDEQLLETPDKQFGFFIFDIDNFKQANDQFGHAFGDACIKEFTRIIKTSFRETDLLGRLGGDEFAAFIPVSSEDWVEEKATELSQSLHTVYSDGANSWEMSASIGIALTSTSIHSFDTLYKSADSALYETKKRGKNSYTVYKA